MRASIFLRHTYPAHYGSSGSCSPFSSEERRLTESISIRGASHLEPKLSLTSLTS
ncbi:hypothetical protein BDQ12DRAFT_473659 [Crucibulum laeve]|uniref:Uncharacterized protein n=1 Tax=Crucibulum laeve TaxID=68775 RepID=A0A5C3LVV5_9AGAR|nr:hypothetical protein BDQ12DRAFT_473659 [Crucibulum laeve]